MKREELTISLCEQTKSINVGMANQFKSPKVELPDYNETIPMQTVTGKYMDTKPSLPPSIKRATAKMRVNGRCIINIHSN